MHPTTTSTALKEWAVTVGALAQGQQIFLLRKGGIREDGKRFSVTHDQFLLYPTYEHQSTDQLKESAREELRSILASPRPADEVTFAHWVEVQDVLDLKEEERVDALYPHHIWTQDYAQKRLRWQPRSPLSLMLLRVYRLLQPVALPYLPEYGGCKSWVQLAEPVPLGAVTPVLSDGAFQRMVEEVKASVALVDVKG